MSIEELIATRKTARHLGIRLAAARNTKDQRAVHAINDIWETFKTTLPRDWLEAATFTFEIAYSKIRCTVEDLLEEP